MYSIQFIFNIHINLSLFYYFLEYFFIFVILNYIYFFNFFMKIKAIQCIIIGEILNFLLISLKYYS